MGPAQPSPHRPHVWTREQPRAAGRICARAALRALFSGGPPLGCAAAWLCWPAPLALGPPPELLPALVAAGLLSLVLLGVGGALELGAVTRATALRRDLAAAAGASLCTTAAVVQLPFQVAYVAAMLVAGAPDGALVHALGDGAGGLDARSLARWGAVAGLAGAGALIAALLRLGQRRAAAIASLPATLLVTTGLHQAVIPAASPGEWLATAGSTWICLGLAAGLLLVAHDLADRVEHELSAAWRLLRRGARS